MRELLLKEEVYDLIELDSLLLQSHYDNSTKKYNVQFLSFNNDIKLPIEELKEAHKYWLRKYMDN